MLKSIADLSPILYGFMNGIPGNTKFPNMHILLDSGARYNK